MDILKIPSTITGVKTMADKGLRIQVDTQELDAKGAGEVMMLKDKFGWLVFAEQITDKDLKDLPKIELEEGEKSPSSRLRATLFVYWEQNKLSVPFDSFYKRQMEKFIQQVKEKLL